MTGILLSIWREWIFKKRERGVFLIRNNGRYDQRIGTELSENIKLVERRKVDEIYFKYTIVRT